jgi:hypothetical protein
LEIAPMMQFEAVFVHDAEMAVGLLLTALDAGYEAFALSTGLPHLGTARTKAEAVAIVLDHVATIGRDSSRDDTVPLSIAKWSPVSGSFEGRSVLLRPGGFVLNLI